MMKEVTFEAKQQPRFNDIEEELRELEEGAAKLQELAAKSPEAAAALKAIDAEFNKLQAERGEIIDDVARSLMPTNINTKH